VIFLILLLSATVIRGQTNVTSQEQFRRLMPDGLPTNFHYNFDRAVLEVTSDEQNCPATSRAFFELHVSKQGEVTNVNGRAVSLSAKLKSVGLKWASALLKQIHFSPLSYGTKPASVNVPVTVVCRSSEPDS
jgi:hypothetical protein